MHVSVVVPTYNRRDLLQLGLRALANQRTSGFTYEVIVCDDGSQRRYAADVPGHGAAISRSASPPGPAACRRTISSSQ